jgi:hypothetical protein
MIYLAEQFRRDWEIQEQVVVRKSGIATRIDIYSILNIHLRLNRTSHRYTWMRMSK